jgi:hypothetical protein
LHQISRAALVIVNVVVAGKLAIDEEFDDLGSVVSKVLPKPLG